MEKIRKKKKCTHTETLIAADTFPILGIQTGSRLVMPGTILQGETASSVPTMSSYNKTELLVT